MIDSWKFPMTRHVYCTYFDSGYLSRGRVLIETLRAQGDTGVVYVLALDEKTGIEVAAWTDLGVILVSLEELEAAYPTLCHARKTRSRLEYFFTLTPWLTKWTLERNAEDCWTTYLDADMAFFAEIDCLYAEGAQSSVMIVEHRFAWDQTWRLKYGRFNVAWVSFRKDSRGQACLNWWADSCLEWCNDETSRGRFADQGYLDDFPSFPGVLVLQHPGADLAPWNLRRHQLEVNDSGSLLVDGEPLLFFHFHGLRKIGRRYHFKHLPYFVRTTKTLRENIYRSYCERLEALEAARDHTEPELLHRKPTLFTSIRSGRTRMLLWLGEIRGDYLDVSPR